MKISSITNSYEVKLKVGTLQYVFKPIRKIEGKIFSFWKAKVTKKEAEAIAAKLKKDRIADQTRVIKHSSGVFLVFRFKDWKNHKSNSWKTKR